MTTLRTLDEVHAAGRAAVKGWELTDEQVARLALLLRSALKRPRRSAGQTPRHKDGGSAA